MCIQCLLQLKLWVRTLFMARCTRYNIMWWSSSVTCDRPVVFSGFLQPIKLTTMGYNWNIVESGIKHHKPNQPIDSVLFQRAKVKFNTQYGTVSCQWTVHKCRFFFLYFNEFRIIKNLDIYLKILISIDMFLCPSSSYITIFWVHFRLSYNTRRWPAKI